MSELSANQRLAVAALDILLSLSPEALRELRKGGEYRHHALIPRRLLKDLADRVEAAYPGVLDDAVRRAAEEAATAAESRPA